MKKTKRPPTKTERIARLEAHIIELRDMVAVVAGTTEKLVEVVCTTDATAPAARHEGLTQRLPF